MFLEHNTRTILAEVERVNAHLLSSSAAIGQLALSFVAPKETDEMSGANISTINPAPWAETRLTIRVMSFANCTNASGQSNLYATVGQQIYKRIDGRSPSWSLVYTNPIPGTASQSGLRGLTAIPNPAGAGQVMLVTVEGTSPRVIRFDPNTNTGVTDLNLSSFVGAAWGTNLTNAYMIAAYNNMTSVNGELLIGFEIRLFRPEV